VLCSVKLFSFFDWIVCPEESDQRDERLHTSHRAIKLAPSKVTPSLRLNLLPLTALSLVHEMWTSRLRDGLNVFSYLLIFARRRLARSGVISVRCFSERFSSNTSRRAIRFNHVLRHERLPLDVVQRGVHRTMLVEFLLIVAIPAAGIRRNGDARRGGNGF
jgi:hypothetical protein